MGHRYNATVDRDETGTWIGLVPEVPGVVTQSRRLDLLPARLVEATAVFLDVEPEDIELEISNLALPPNLMGAVDRATHLRTVADEAAVGAGAASRAAARALVDEGLSMRDAGALLGLSHQRVGQLIRT
jgi:predicted RNase H-like HicB family nuclease